MSLRFQNYTDIMSQSLLKLMSIELVTPSNHLILCCPFSSCPQSFPASGSFPVSQLLTSGGQSIGASASILPMNSQGWFPSGLTGLIFFAVQETLKSLLQHHNSKASILWCSAFFVNQLCESTIHDYWKNDSFDYIDFCWQSDVSAF